MSILILILILILIISSYEVNLGKSVHWRAEGTSHFYHSRLISQMMVSIF